MIVKNNKTGQILCILLDKGQIFCVSSHKPGGWGGRGCGEALAPTTMQGGVGGAAERPPHFQRMNAMAKVKTKAINDVAT